MSLVLDSTLTCPACGVAKLETMPPTREHA
jgi:hypothetical protein